LAGRKRSDEGVAELLAHQQRSAQRGEVRWFLWDEYERLRGQRMSWGVLLADIQKLGLTTAKGEPVMSMKTLQSTWTRVCRDKAREAEAKQQRARDRPKKPTDDPPPVVSRTQASPPQPIRSAVGWDSWDPAKVGASSGTDGQDDIDHVMKVVKERSRWRE